MSSIALSLIWISRMLLVSILLLSSRSCLKNQIDEDRPTPTPNIKDLSLSKMVESLMYN